MYTWVPFSSCLPNEAVVAHSSGNNLRRVVLEGEEGGNRRWKDDLRKNHSPFLCSLSSSSEKEPLRNVEAGAARVLRPIFILLDDEAEHRRVKKEEVEVPHPNNSVLLVFSPFHFWALLEMVVVALSDLFRRPHGG